MNAQDLYAIVSKVKRERWPMGMIWAPIATKFFIDEVDQAIPDDHAEMLFASAFRQSLHREQDAKLNGGGQQHGMESEPRGTSCPRRGHGHRQGAAILRDGAVSQKSADCQRTVSGLSADCQRTVSEDSADGRVANLTPAGEQREKVDSNG